ncbi:hypothetical protein [Mesorhizobium sp. B2-1-2]|uniref:hypothetical protein n=1 Tax=Mesorhizobium sp. B2-1-2 TaxID=2589973 RepID=UPI00112D998D|nr:hypothetical protein [Mesorhizobium sp. B2-1-2]TPN11685.1 hypothetical protein FJ971_09765 [Mesorhizobium sp. B2-1-2]
MRVTIGYPDNEPQQLVGLQTKVCPDGSEATITIHTATGSVDLNIAFDNMAAVQAEIRSASLLMLYRQSMSRDAGAHAISGLLATALVPAATDVVIDAKTGDRFFLMHFADRMPIVIRRTPEQLSETLADVATEVRRIAN